MNKCPLCLEESSREFCRDKKRCYFQCDLCHLVWVASEYHLSPSAEKAEYDKHQNNPNDKGYRQFLSRTLTPLLERMTPASEGLDFGCGPGPAISVMAEEKGIKIHNYDLYYFNHPELLERSYDFVTMTEVIEHLASPALLLQKLDVLLKPGGILAIMTKRVIDRQAFASWHYKNDPTHICFYSVETFEWIGRQSGWRLEVIDKDVVFFHKDQ